jgi:hypothetical protein
MEKKMEKRIGTLQYSMFSGGKGKGTQHIFGWVVANRFWISSFD